MKNKRLYLLISLFFSLFSSTLFCAELTENVTPFLTKLPATAAKIIRVKRDAIGANNGTSWPNAYKELTDALANAEAGDQIWITGDRYYPTRGTDRSASFMLKSGISIYGQFEGTENSVQERTFRTTVTTQLSGDIGRAFDSTDNSYHIVRGENISNVLLDHIRILDGNANGTSLDDKKGAGLYLSFSGNVVYSIDCQFVLVGQCTADTEGGAAYIACKQEADCRFNFYATSFDRSRANLGGGLFLDLDKGKCLMQTTYFSGCRYSEARESGGGVYIRNAQKSRIEWRNGSNNFEVFSIQDCKSLVKGGGLYLISSDSSTAKFNWKQESGLGIENNQSGNGGGAYIESLSSADNDLSFEGLQLDGNVASGNDCKGGVFSNNATSGKSVLKFRNCPYFTVNSLTNNALLNGKGTVIYNTGNNGLSGLSFTNCNFRDNKNLVGSGGVIYNEDNNAVISFLRCDASNLLASQDGGFAYMNGGHLRMDSCTVTRKSTIGGTGGFIFFKANEGQHELSIANSYVDSIYAASSSVLHVVASGTATITPYIYKTLFLNTFNSNTTTLNAPFTFQVVGRMAKIANGKAINSIFSRGKGYAGAIVHEANSGLCDMTYTNCLFLKNVGATASIVNKAANTEGACKTTFQNALFWENLNLSGGQGRTVLNQNETSPNATPKPQPIFTYCLVPETDCVGLDQSQCSSNIFGQDPLLIEPYQGNFDLLPCSPAINAGNTAFVPVGLTNTTDYRRSITTGNVPRIWQSIVDIGATEYTGENHEFSRILDTSNRTILADKEYQDAEGWTHYYNCAEKKLLLSAKNGSDNLGRLTDSLKISVTTAADYDIKGKNLRGADYLTNPNCDKWFVMNRYWKATGARDIGRAMDIRFYFTPKDSADLQKATPFNAYQDMAVYDVTKALAHDTLVRGIGGTFNSKAKDAVGSLTKWKLLLEANYRTAQYQTMVLNGSGSAGVLVPYGTRITEIDTFVCSNTVLKIGDKELYRPGIYTLTLKTANGCDSVVRIKITHNAAPYKQFANIRPDNGFNSGRIFADDATNFMYRWNTGDTISLIQNLKAGFYTVTITSYGGCKDTFTYEVKSVLPLQMPNAFTPNGDSLNDFFAPVTYGNPKITAFKIFNRTGQMVYDNEAPDKGWDGQSKGQDAGSDVYVYWIELDYGKGNILRGRGEVNLIR